MINLTTFFNFTEEDVRIKVNKIKNKDGDSVSVWENITSIIRSLDIKAKEASIGRSIVKTSTVEAKFLEEYESFKVPLYNLLEKFITFEGGKSVIVRPKNQNSARFLRYTMEDPSISGSYKIVQKAGGEFEYQQGVTLDEIFTHDEVEVEEEDENVIYI